jgi:hypothetical protein
MNDETTANDLAPCPVCGGIVYFGRDYLIWSVCDTDGCGYESPARPTDAEAAAVHNALALAARRGKMAEKLANAAGLAADDIALLDWEEEPTSLQRIREALAEYHALAPDPTKEQNG